jgi:hypothetical protein
MIWLKAHAAQNAAGQPDAGHVLAESLAALTLVILESMQSPIS